MGVAIIYPENEEKSGLVKTVKKDTSLKYCPVFLKGDCSLQRCGSELNNNYQVCKIYQNFKKYQERIC